MMRQGHRSFVERLGFRTSVGFGDGPGDRERLGLTGAGPTLVVTDLGVLRPDPATCELTLTDIHPGVTVDEVKAATGWDLAVSGDLAETPAVTAEELEHLRGLEATKRGGE